MNFKNEQLKLSKNKMAFLGRTDVTGNVERLHDPLVFTVERTEALEGRGGCTI